MLSQISSQEDHVYDFLRMIYEEKFIPDFMAQKILKVFGGFDFRVEERTLYTGYLEEPRHVSRLQLSF